MSSRLEFDDIHCALRESVDGWAKAFLEPGAAERDENHRFDAELYRQLDTELGLMNITLPEPYGGSGLDLAATVISIESLSACDPGMAMSYLSQELLFSHQLYFTWLNEGIGRMPGRHGDILRQKSLAGMAMTEPDAGTDVFGMKTRASEDSDGFVLNGVKQWITNGTNGRYFLVYARTGDNRRDLSLFLVEADREGFVRSSCAEKMGMRSSETGILTFVNCHIPADALVGKLHEGVKPMIRNLAAERLGLAAQSVGIAGRCVSVMRDYVQQRTAFGRPIAEFGQIQHMIARSYAEYHAMRSMLYDTVWSMIEGAPDASLNADATKLFCAHAAEEISRCAIQALGANGYSNAYPVSRLHRDAVLLSIGGGTDEALEKNISRLLTKSRA